VLESPKVLGLINILFSLINIFAFFSALNLMIVNFSIVHLFIELYSLYDFVYFFGIVHNSLSELVTQLNEFVSIFDPLFIIQLS